MMSAKRLTEIKRRLKAATKGPWDGDASGIQAGKTAKYEHIFDTYPYEGGAFVSYRAEEDVALMVHAWEDIRDLLTEIDRLKAVATAV